MIEVKLLVEEYCNNCPFFNPKAVNRRRFNESFNPDYEVAVICEHKEQCGYLINHLSKKDGGK